MRKIIVVDIDGTIADCQPRSSKYLYNMEFRDWDAFYAHCGEDLPIENVCRVVESLSTQYYILFLTGRRESCKKDTEEWLAKYLPACKEYSILFRQQGDVRQDTIVKPELLNTFIESPEEVVAILEDRECVVKKWRELGYTCLQVADHRF